jgi:2-oxoglutarate ferredoxin oxidoreductase subunit delta
MAEAECVATEAPVTRTKAPPEIQIKVSWCKGCGLCVDYCNRGVLEMKDALPIVVNAERCSRCMLCEAICPDFAITVMGKGTAGGDEGGAS